jgi:hypothetical protein
MKESERLCLCVFVVGLLIGPPSISHTVSSILFDALVILIIGFTLNQQVLVLPCFFLIKQKISDSSSVGPFRVR